MEALRSSQRTSHATPTASNILHTGLAKTSKVAGGHPNDDPDWTGGSTPSQSKSKGAYDVESRTEDLFHRPEAYDVPNPFLLLPCLCCSPHILLWYLILSWFSTDDSGTVHQSSILHFSVLTPLPQQATLLRAMA